MSLTPQLDLFSLPPDICRSRHGGNPQSEQANRRVEPYKRGTREHLLAIIRACGEHGATLLELSAHFCKTPNAISGRLTELKRDGRVLESGELRKGCAVLVAAG